MKEQISNLIRNKKTLLTIICFIFGLIYIAYVHSNIEIENGFVTPGYNKFYWIIAFSLLIILIGIIILIRKKEIKTHILFIILATVFGAYYLIVAPVQNGSDEAAHFYRTFEIATGHFTTIKTEDGRYIEKDLPKSFTEMIGPTNSDKEIKIHELGEVSKIELNKEYTEEVKANDGASVYSPMVYLPQAIGLKLGMLFNAKPLVIANLARIFGFVFWVAVCAYAIKIAPSKKTFLLVLALIPSNIASAVTISADTILNAFSILLIAKVFQLIEKEDKIKVKDYLTLLFSTIIIGQCKIAYLPLTFLCWLIPSDRYKNKKMYILGNIGIMVTTLLLTFIWSRLIAGLYTSVGQEQKEWILSYPFNYVIVMFRTLIQSFDKLFYGIAAGNDLYLARVAVPQSISFGLMLVLIISLFIEESKIKLNNIKKIIVIGMIVVIAVLILTAMYVSATPLITGKNGTEIILGAQGRYFIPIIPLLILLITKKRIHFEEKSLYSIFMILEFACILHVLQTFI